MLLDIRANSCFQDYPFELRRKCDGHYDLFLANSARISMWFKQEVNKKDEISAGGTSLSEKRSSLSSRFEVGLMCSSLTETPAHAFWTEGAWWFLYYLLPHGLFPLGTSVKL